MKKIFTAQRILYVHCFLQQKFMKNMFTRRKWVFYVYYCLHVEMLRGFRNSQNQIYKIYSTKRDQIFFIRIYQDFFMTLLIYPLFYTLTKIHMYFLSVNYSTPTQLFKIPGYTFINKNRDVANHSGVAVYIKDDIQFIRRTDLEINELECIWLEINFPNRKNVLISVWCVVLTPVYIKISTQKI